MKLIGINPKKKVLCSYTRTDVYTYTHARAHVYARANARAHVYARAHTHAHAITQIKMYMVMCMGVVWMDANTCLSAYSYYFILLEYMRICVYLDTFMYVCMYVYM